jgi:hypothetical protein
MRATVLKEPFGTATAIAASALVPAVVMCAGSPSYYGSPGILTVIALMTYFIAIWAAVLVGVPLLLLGLRFRLVAWWSAAIAGFLVGTVVDCVVHVASFPPRDGSEMVGLGGLGSLTGLVFWGVRRLSLGKERSVEWPSSVGSPPDDR